MENIELIIYGIFFLIYLVSTVLRKKRKQEKKSQAPQEAQEDAPKPFSFEDLLRELGQEVPEEEAEPGDLFDRRKEENPYNQRRQEEAEAEVAEKGSQGEEWKSNFKTSSDIYNESVERASKVSTLDERIDLEDDEPILKEFEGVGSSSLSNPLAEEVVKAMQNPEGARKAFIYTEIFNRKY